MEEKVLIKSEQYSVKKLFKTLVVSGLVLTVLGTIISISDSCNYYHRNYGADHEHDRWCYEYYWMDDYYDDKRDGGLQEWKMDCYQVVYGNAFSYAISNYFEYEFIFCIIPVAAFALIGGLIYLWLRSYELTITDKRIYGKVAWGKRVDLPVDSVSATATINLLKGVSVSTSSGRISFLVIKNAEAIYKVISNLLIERQQEKAKSVAAASAPKSDSADELKKFKELLDMGVITQEEFDAKKKQLLGL